MKNQIEKLKYQNNMKKLILIILFLLPFIIMAQDPKPNSPPAIKLQTPNNPTFWYNESDSTIHMYKGSYG